jgi:hypothetical protein
VIHPLDGYYGDDYRFIMQDQVTVHTERSWQNMVDNTYAGTKLGDYQLLMVPHMTTNTMNNPFAWVVPTRKHIQTKLGYTGSFDTYYAFFIRRDSECFNALSEMLANFGAIDFASYKNQKQAYVTKQTENTRN